MLDRAGLSQNCRPISQFEGIDKRQSVNFMLVHLSLDFASTLSNHKCKISWAMLRDHTKPHAIVRPTWLGQITQVFASVLPFWTFSTHSRSVTWAREHTDNHLLLSLTHCSIIIGVSSFSSSLLHFSHHGVTFWTRLQNLPLNSLLTFKQALGLFIESYCQVILHLTTWGRGGEGVVLR